MKKVCVIGLGYIGLPTASLLATKGFDVHGVDINPNIVEKIDNGQIHINEPDLDILVKAAVQSGKMVCSTQPEPADIFIIAVPTPFKDDHVPNLSYVESATRAIVPWLNSGNLIIIESTIPVGTTEKVADWVREIRPDLFVPTWSTFGQTEFMPSNRISLAHCPERVLPGQILRELIDNDRLAGGIDKQSSIEAQDFYRSFIRGNMYLTDSRTAELAKLTENAFRDVNIAFANELSLICDKLHINVWELIELANKHPRVNILQPGPGVGGHCIAVDPWFIVHSAVDESELIKTARKVNDNKPYYIIKRIKERAARFKEPVIACLGLSYKADVNDLRESPALEIVLSLARESVGLIYLVEPHLQVIPDSLSDFTNIIFDNLPDALEKADIVVLLVNHRYFRDIHPDLLKSKVVFDTCGFWR